MCQASSGHLAKLTYIARSLALSAREYVGHVPPVFGDSTEVHAQGTIVAAIWHLGLQAAACAMCQLSRHRKHGSVVMRTLDVCESRRRPSHARQLVSADPNIGGIMGMERE